MYCQNLLVVSLYYWDSTTNTFQLPCGILTPTLFNVAAITGFHPDGDRFYPNEKDEDNIECDNNRAGFTRYIEDYHVTDTSEAFAEEYIAFLALWLFRCVLCCRSLKVAKRYITLANQPHEGNDVCISQLILGSFYAPPGEATEALRNIKPKDSLLLAGLFCLLQLWLSATFESPLTVKHLDDTDPIISGQSIKGVWLNLLTSIDKSRSNREALCSYFMMFAKSYSFAATMAPFSKRAHGPKWFT